MHFERIYVWVLSLLKVHMTCTLASVPFRQILKAGPLPVCWKESLRHPFGCKCICIHVFLGLGLPWTGIAVSS
jgi:hypothetical protein